MDGGGEVERYRGGFGGLKGGGGSLLLRVKRTGVQHMLCPE